MQKESTKFQNSLIFEGMTSIRAAIAAIDLGISDRRIDKIYYDKNRMRKIAKEVGYFKAVSNKYGFELCESTGEEIEKMTLGSSHGGIVGLFGERTVPHLDASSILPFGFYAMLQGIEDPYNFGYAMRSLYAAGCNGIIVGERNWLSAAGVLARSSAGASELIPIYTAAESNSVRIFKSLGYNVVCADLNTEEELGKTALPYPIFLIIGGERRGINAELLAMADKLVKIPYERDFHASLSAASAATMFAYEIMRQKRASVK